MSGEGLLIADIGTASGCIAIALAKEAPFPAKILTRCDISPAALAVATQSTRFGFADRIIFLESPARRTFRRRAQAC